MFETPGTFHGLIGAIGMSGHVDVCFINKIFPNTWMCGFQLYFESAAHIFCSNLKKEEVL